MIRYNHDNDDDEDMDNVEMSDDNCSEKDSFSGKPSETETGVFGFGNNDNDGGDDEEDDENEQVSADYNFDIPDTRAWGKKKKTYYRSDYVDTDFASLTERDEKSAKVEEEEAKIIQKRMAKELDDVDFCLNTVSDNKNESKEDTSHVIKIDMRKFSKRQKLELLEKESPEFSVLIQDIKDQLVDVKSTLGPYVKLMKRENHSNNAAFKFIQTKYQTALHYCFNIIFYLTLKSKRLFFNSHPVIKRLAQYRQLLNQMNSIQEPVLHNLQEMSQLSENQKLKLKVGDGHHRISDEKLKQKVHFKHNIDEKLIEEDSDEEIEESHVDNNIVNDFDDNAERRTITYQMAKNKGLTPHRSKEQRNPRVKHRNKYRKAMIRRKGAVREVRTELQRYGGEMSGIKIGVKKSVTLK